MKRIQLIAFAVTALIGFNSCQDGTGRSLERIADNTDCSTKIHDLKMEIISLQTQLKVYKMVDSAAKTWGKK